MILVDKKWGAQRIIFNNTTLVEIIAVDIVVDHVKLIIVCLYIPPYFLRPDLGNVLNLLSAITTDNEFVILEDFNMPKIYWTHDCDEEGIIDEKILLPMSNSAISPYLTNQSIITEMTYIRVGNTPS